MPDALLIADDPQGSAAAAVRDAATTTGVSCVAVSAHPDLIVNALLREGGECAVALLAPDLERPVLVARQVHRAASGVHVIVVADEVAPMQRRLAREPLAGTKWTVVPLHGPQLPAAVRHAVGAGRRARQLRTTLNRFSARLAAPRPAEAADFRRLHLSDRFLRALVTATPDAVFAVDPWGRIASWNPAAERMFQLSAADAVGRTLAERLPPAVEAALTSAIDRVMAGTPQVVSDVVLDGSEAPFEVLTVPVLDEDALIAVLCVARDMTLRRTVQQMQEHARQKDEFLMTLSHELRTPLNAILGWVSMVRHEQADPARTQRAMQVIERNAQLQMNLVADLLEVARIMSGKARLNVETMDVAANVHAAVDSLRPLASGKPIDVAVECEASLGSIDADPSRFQQIVRNLMSNAIKFTPAGGAVLVKADRTPAGVRLLVRDTGPGIDPAFLPFVFDRFRQQESHARAEGLGLGLSIVKHFSELHQGSVTAENNPGGGATFTVVLPAIAGSGSAAPQP